MAKLSVEMLGWLRAQAGRTVLRRFRTRKTAALFAYLAFHGDRSHPRELLVELLWPDATDLAKSNNSLSQALSSLRRDLARSGGAVGTLLEADRTSVQLHAVTDVGEFQAAVAACAGGREDRIASLFSAQQLYRGELLPGHYQEWVLSERSGLRDLYIKATHELVTLLRKAGDLRAAAAAAHRGVRADPLSEEAVRDLMQAHLEAREPQLALRAYHELETSLKGDVGVRPSALTRELARRIAASFSVSAGEPVPLLPRAGPATVTSVLVQILGGRGPRALWPKALAGARERIKCEIAQRGGELLRDEAASVVAGFAHPLEALDCAVHARAELRRLSWPTGKPMEMRLALDTFLLAQRDGETAGVPDSVQRLAQAGSPGDVVLSEATAALVRRGRAGLLLRELPGALPERLYRILFPVEEPAPIHRLVGLA